MERLLKVGDMLTVAVDYDGELIQTIWLPSDQKKTNIFELFSSDEIRFFENKLAMIDLKEAA